MSNNVAFGRVRQNVGRPPFLVDRDALVLDTGRQIAWELIGAGYEYGSVEVEASAEALADAESISVVALPAAMPAGTVLQFGADKYATTTADAEAGAVSIDVEPLVTTVDSGDIAYFDSNPQGMGGQIQAGTVMAELDDGRMIPRAAVTGSETAKYLLATTANEESETDAVTGYGVIKSAAVYENLLPDASGDPAVITSGWKTELLAHGGYWMFEQYSDNTA